MGLNTRGTDSAQKWLDLLGIWLDSSLIRKTRSDQKIWLYHSLLRSWNSEWILSGSTQIQWVTGKTSLEGFDKEIVRWWHDKPSLVSYMYMRSNYGLHSWPALILYIGSFQIYFFAVVQVQKLQVKNPDVSFKKVGPPVGWLTWGKKLKSTQSKPLYDVYASITPPVIIPMDTLTRSWYN